MISHRTLATAMFVAAGVVGGNAVASSTRTGSSLPPNDAKVTALSVVPDAASHAEGSRADVVIRVDGAISLKHFTMAKPDKIVIDLAGASLGVPAGDSYDGVARGGITRVRYSQFTKSTVRVVLMLDAPHAYNVVQKDGEVCISSVTAVIAPFVPATALRGPRDRRASRAQPHRAQPVRMAAARPRARPAAARASRHRLRRTSPAR